MELELHDGFYYFSEEVMAETEPVPPRQDPALFGAHVEFCEDYDMADMQIGVIVRADEKGSDGLPKSLIIRNEQGRFFDGYKVVHRKLNSATGVI